MKLLFFDNNPFQPLEFWSGAGASLITGGASLLGGITGLIGQNSANATNLKIARETNAANRANQEYQNEWNLSMWNKQNAYNTPLAQRQRLEAAGLNPIFFGLDGTGNAGALQSAPFTAVNGAPMLNSAEPLANSLMNAGSTMASSALAAEQAKLTKEQTFAQSLSNQLENATLGTKIKVGNLQFELTEAELGRINANKDLFIKQAEECDAQITALGESLDLMRQRLSFDRWKAIVDNEFREKEQELTKRGLDIEEIKIAKQFAVDMYNAKTNRLCYRLNKLNSVSLRNSLDSTTNINNAQAENWKIRNKYEDSVQFETLASIVAHTFKTDQESRELEYKMYFGSSIVGDFFRCGMTLAEVFGGHPSHRK